jgi:hypothetical protein
MVRVKRTDGEYVTIKRTPTVGGARMWMAPPSHANLVSSQEGYDQLRKVLDGGWYYGATLLGRRGEPLSKGELSVSRGTGGMIYPPNYFDTRALREGDMKMPKGPSEGDMLTFARNYVAKGSNKGEMGDWTLGARTIRLSKPECLSCHPGSKLKDPIGVLVFMVSPFKTSK